MMMEFKTMYDRERVVSDPGSPWKIEYAPVFDEKGVWHLEETGKTSLYDEIQSHAASVDINLIMKQIEAGDPSVLNKRHGVYLDVTQFPQTYAEMLNIVINGEKEFMELPLDVRAKFNHSFSEFCATIGSNEWNEKLGFVSQKEDITPVEDEVKEVKADE